MRDRQVGKTTPKNILKMEASEHLTARENLTRAMSQLGRKCYLCGGGATTPVVLVSKGEYAKMIGAPTDGRNRLAIVALCTECVGNSNHVERIKDKLVNQLNPERN